MIYFDNAATTWPKPPEVTRAILEAIDSFGNPSRGSHPFSLAATRCVEDARTLAATLFGCPEPSRVAFTKNVTEALNIAVASIDGHIVSSEAEHNSVLRPVYKHGNFSIVPVDQYGRYTVEDVAEQCRAETKAVVLGHASNLTGNVLPIADIGRFCREKGILLIVDAAQSAGLLAIDMTRMNIDALCFTGHKSLYGLQGAGGICAGVRFTPRPLIVGGSGSMTFSQKQPPDMPGVLEAGTLNSHGIAALAAGLRYVLEQTPQRLLRRADSLAKRFLRGLDGIPGITTLGDCKAEERVPLVALNIGGLDASDVAAELDEEYGIAVRAGSHCAPLLHKRFGTEKQGAVRFSFSHFNTENEIDAALNALRIIAEESQAR